MNLRFTTVENAARSIQSTYFPDFHPFSKRGSNAPDWWILPRREKVAYHRAKFLLTENDLWVNPGYIFCGFHAEKGLLVPEGANRNRLMTDDWYWHRFLRLSDVEVTSTIEEAKAVLDKSVDLCIVCEIPQLPTAKTVAIFESNEDDELKLNTRLGDDDAGLLTDFASSASISDFWSALRSHDRDARTHFYWTSVIIGKSFTRNVSGDDDTERCLYMLRVFEPWVRSSA